MIDIQLDASIVDGFTEMVNIAMGSASDTLARLLNTLVEIKAPLVESVNAKQLQSHVQQCYPNWISLQPFYGAVDGEILALVNQFDIISLGSLLGYSADESSFEQDSIVIELISALSGSCLSSLTKNLHLPVKSQMPRVLHMHEHAALLDFANDSLMIEIEFVVNNLNFDCKLIFLVGTTSLKVIEQSVIAFAKAYNVDLS